MQTKTKKELCTFTSLLNKQADGKIWGMKHKVDFFKEHPNMVFTSSDILTLVAFPWARSSRTLTRLIKQDLEKENVLQAEVTGSGSRTRYLIKGKNITKYLIRYGDALAMMARRSI